MSHDYKYKLDKTGTARTNLVIDEKWPLKDINKSRIIAVNFGMFFSKSVKIKVASTGRSLVLGKDYRIRCSSKDATMNLNLAVSGIIQITDKSLAEDILITYQAVGGKYATYDGLIIEMIENLIDDNRDINFDDIVNKPEYYNPGPHTHNAVTDLYGDGRLVAATQRIADAVIQKDKETLTKELMALIVQKVDKTTPTKVGLAGNTYKAYKALSRAVMVRLPKHKSQSKNIVIQMVIASNNTVDRVVITARESGSGFADVNLLNLGTSLMPLKFKLVTHHSGETDLLVYCGTETGKKITDYQVSVIDYTVACEDPHTIAHQVSFAEMSDIELNRYTFTESDAPKTVEIFGYVRADRQLRLDTPETFTRIANNQAVVALQLPKVGTGERSDASTSIDGERAASIADIVMNVTIGSREETFVYEVCIAYDRSSKVYRLRDVRYDKTSPTSHWFSIHATGGNYYLVIRGDNNLDLTSHGNHLDGYFIVNSIVVNTEVPKAWNTGWRVLSALNTAGAVFTRAVCGNTNSLTNKNKYDIKNSVWTGNNVHRLHIDVPRSVAENGRCILKLTAGHLNRDLMDMTFSWSEAPGSTKNFRHRIDSLGGAVVYCSISTIVLAGRKQTRIALRLPANTASNMGWNSATLAVTDFICNVAKPTEYDYPIGWGNTTPEIPSMVQMLGSVNATRSRTITPSARCMSSQDVLDKHLADVRNYIDSVLGTSGTI